MERKEALNVISQKLEAGQTKQEIFRELLSKVKFKSDLIQYLAMVPAYEDRVRYNSLNMILFCLLILICVSKIMIGALLLSHFSLYAMPFALLIPFIAIYFAVGVKNFRGNMYRALGFLSAAGVLKSMTNIEHFSTYTIAQILIELMFWIPGILVVILSFYIGYKVFPYYGFWGNLKEDKLNLSSG